MMPRRPQRPHGETLALMLKALREHPHGLTAKEVARETGIEHALCVVQLANYRSVNHVESRGPRPQRWFIYRGEPPAVSPQLVTPRSVFVPDAPPVRPLFAIGSSRVMANSPCFVKPDDFTPGAFMRDWVARTTSSDRS